MTVSRLKVRFPTKFPAAVNVTAPLTLSRTGGSYNFGINPALGAVGPTGAGYGGTSTTSLVIGTGSKSFVTQSGYAYQAGNYIRASSAADGTNFMEGTISSYIGTSLVVSMTKTGGSGTKTDWTFSLAGTPGSNGAGSGDMLAANNLSDVGNKKTSLDNISIHGADVASATTTNLETSTGDLIDVTGTTTITAITLNEGHERTVRFTGALILTNGASLVLPGGANITTAAGDFAVFRGYAASVVRCVSYDRASGITANAAAFLAAPSSANLRAAMTDETGTGLAVFATSPTLTTPNIVGTSTNDSAAAGSVGEYQETVVNSGAAVALTSGAVANLMTISLTAGDWDVWANVTFLAGAGTTTSEYHICISTVSATLQFNPSAHALHASIPASQSGILPTGVLRASLAGTTTYYLVTTQTFAAGTLSGYGFLCARRRR